MDPYEVGIREGPASEERVARSVAGDVATRLVGLMSHYTGRGPTRVSATVNTNLIAIVMQEALTKGEQNLVAAGQVEAVLDMRRKFHGMMRDEAIGAVEELTSRSVVTVLADIDPQQNVAGLLFVLERVPETGIAATAEATSDDT